MSTLYSAPLLALAKAQTHRAPLRSPTHKAHASNTLCGDDIEVSLVVRGDRVEAVSFQPRACAVCQASATLMAEMLEGATLSEISALSASLERTLLGEGDDPRFSALEPVSEHPSRRVCARLPWRALEDALLSTTREQFSTPAPTASPASLPETAWDAALEMMDRGEDVAIATLLSVVGSSPCPAGSRMIISSTGLFWGAVSGGCVESAVVHTAVALMADPAQHAKVLPYQISNSQAGEVGLACGGQIMVHITRAPSREVLLGYKRATIDGAVRALKLEDGTAEVYDVGNAPASLRAEVRACLEHGEPRELPEYGVFLEPLVRPRQLVMVGGTQVAQKLCALAREVGYEPVVLDPRSAMANSQRFPGVTLCSQRPEEGLEAWLGPRAAVVMLTHDKALDDPALVVALASQAFYVGALGSRKTQRGRLERLRERGVGPERLARLRGPAGLAIGAKGPAEIALSILAEVVAAQRQAEVRPRVGALVVAASDPQALEACDAAGLTPALEVASEGLGEGVAALLAHGPLDAVVVVHAAKEAPTVASLTALRQAHTTGTRHLVITEDAAGAPTLWPRRCLDDLMAGATERALKDEAPGAILTIPAAS